DGEAIPPILLRRRGRGTPAGLLLSVARGVGNIARRRGRPLDSSDSTSSTDTPSRGTGVIARTGSTRGQGGRAPGAEGRRGVGMSMNRTEKEQVRVHIRWMIRRDMPEVLQTEQESFEYAWTEEDFLRCLRQRNCIGMVAEQGEKVVGFMIYELHKQKLHILNFAVHPTCRRSGVGGQMSAKLMSKLSSHRRTRITLEVRETNLTAQL